MSLTERLGQNKSTNEDGNGCEPVVTAPRATRRFSSREAQKGESVCVCCFRIVIPEARTLLCWPTFPNVKLGRKEEEESEEETCPSGKPKKNLK